MCTVLLYIPICTSLTYHPTGGRKKNQLLLQEGIDTHHHTIRGVHRDWVTHIQYIAELSCILTSSLDGCIRFIELTKGR